MARAKRTSRAEARRRYRAQLAAEANTADAGADDPNEGIEDLEGVNAASARAAAPGPTSRRPTRTAARTATTAGPPTAGGEAPQGGIRYGFRAAFRPANLREDLAHLREIVLSRAVIIPSAISIGTAIALGATGGNELFSRLLAQYFLVPPPIGSIFIAGFFAKRASYIAGFVVGLVAALALTALLAILPALGGGAAGLGPVVTPTPIATTPAASATPSVAASSSASGSASAAPSASASPSATTPASPTPSPSPAAPVNTTEIATYALVTSPIAGILFASAAAWYRRFLQLSNPNRAARANRNARGRPSNNRRR